MTKLGVKRSSPAARKSIGPTLGAESQLGVGLPSFPPRRNLKPVSGTLTILKSRPRKTTFSLDTNLNSYDRTDPFTAFNVILKLLGTLPSRVGGCQYRLTPAEHKLVIHLLSIVEPFIGTSPCSSRGKTLVSQPTEILDTIVSHLDTRKDLLAVGLSCKRLYDIIFPRHFDYRIVKCKISSIRVWNHLIVHKSLARNVRRLEILDERASKELETIPKDIMITDTDLEESSEATADEGLGGSIGLSFHEKHERYLVAALMRMTGLDTFVWGSNHSPISIWDIWSTLLECQSLKSVEINDNLIFKSLEVDGEAQESDKPKGMMLPRMRSFTLRSTQHNYGSVENPTLDRAIQMLQHCPDLNALDVTYHSPRGLPNTRPIAHDIFLGRWPQLTSLTLTNVRCSNHGLGELAASFFVVHSNLEVLHLDLSLSAGSAIGRLSLPYNALPRLRELHASRDIANSILECPSEAQRPLETVTGFRLASGRTYGGVDADEVFLTNLGRYGKQLKRIQMTGWRDMEDVRRVIECVPAVTWLDIGKKLGNQQVRDRIPTNMPVSNAIEWVDLISTLPELTILQGVRFFYELLPQTTACAMTGNGIYPTLPMTERSRYRKNDEIAGMLAWKCPKLRRLDHWEEGTGKFIVLTRDGHDKEGKARWEIKRVKA